VAAPHQGVPEQIHWQKHIRHGCALSVKSGNIYIIFQYILTALADATNDLSMPCHEQRPFATTEYVLFRHIGLKAGYNF